MWRRETQQHLQHTVAVARPHSLALAAAEDEAGLLGMDLSHGLEVFTLADLRCGRKGLVVGLDMMV